MTRQWNGYGTATPFSLWIRELDDSTNYDVQNLDYVRFHYREGWFITVEEKRYGHSPRPAQMDTHKIISQMLAFASNTVEVRTMRGIRPIECRGHYIVSFENTCPNDSSWVRVNGKEYRDVAATVTKLFKTGTLDQPPASGEGEQ